MELDARKQRILDAIVRDYIATAEPVGSQVLVQRYSLGVKSATLRNEMAEMSERGYLRQPHTSAGRIPSSQGYRFYVDRLMPLPMVPAQEASMVRRAVASASSELDTILRKTCALLATMTKLPALATSPDADDTELRQVFVSPAGTDKTLLVLLFSTGRTEHRLLPGQLSASEALVLAHALNDRFSGQALATLRTASVDDSSTPAELRSVQALYVRLAGEIVAASRSVGEDTPMYVEGAHAALEHPEFRDVERLGQFLATLQKRAALIEMLRVALEERPSAGSAPNAPTETVRVVIGEENQRGALNEYSVVSSTYFVGARERGSIAVLGPTRMDYSRAAAAVRFMARTMGDLLTRLSVT